MTQRAALIEAYERIHAESWVKVEIDGASIEANARAAQDVAELFRRHGLSALDAASGAFALESWDDQGFPPDAEPSARDAAAGRVWLEAQDLVGPNATFDLQYDRDEYEAVCKALGKDR